MNTSVWEIVYRFVSLPSRALTDAKLVMWQIFGGTTEWDDFVKFYQDGPANHHHSDPYPEDITVRWKTDLVKGRVQQ